MTNTYEAHKLAISNLATIEQAYKIIANEVEPKVFSAIDKKFEEFVENEDWSEDGDFDYLGDGIIFKPKAWLQEEDESYLNYFELNGFEEEEEDKFRLSHLTGATGNRIGIYFCVDVKTATKKPKGGSKLWQKFLAENESALQLREHGFELSDDWLFLPILIDPVTLAESYPNAINDALVPFDEALEKIKNNLPLFEKIISDAETHFNPVGIQG